MNNSRFLGRGWAFPPEFDTRSGNTVMVEAEDDIHQSLIILFLTKRGERVMHPEYGTALHELVFEPMNAETKTAIERNISNAVLHFEPRIILQSVSIKEPDWPGSWLSIALDYTIVETNTRSNVVFPFYLQEGTLLADAPSLVQNS